jgi:acetate kinase
MSETVVALNAGSSSIKFAVFSAEENPVAVWRGQAESIGTTPVLTIRSTNGRSPETPPPLPSSATSHSAVAEFLLHNVVAERAGRCVAVGHRVVHGGSDFSGPVLIDDAALVRIAALAPLARSHQPHNLAGIRAALAAWPDIPHVACFDTAFHRTLPEAEQLFAIPYQLAEQGVRRYGFHGLSYEAIARQLPDHLGAAADGKVIVAHLGNGASLCGMVGRQSRATTMGLTPLDGLVMGRRPGRLDPGVLLHLMTEKNLDAEQLSEFLNRECALYGLSGISADMREVLASSSEGASRAVAVFVARLVAEIGSMAASIGGLDALVFTGGIGENAAPIRAAAVDRLAWLGAELDAAANQENRARISTAQSRIPVLVLPTDEEQAIASHAVRHGDSGGAPG